MSKLKIKIKFISKYIKRKKYENKTKMENE